jgi:hypothetical protein
VNGRLTIAALGLLLASLYIATSAEGIPVVEAKCWPNRPDIQDPDNYHVGWYRNSSNPRPGGVYSLILNYSPWIQPGRFASAWTMLADSSHWAQVGWWEYAYDDRRTFVQWGSTGGWDMVWFSAQPTGNWTYYTVLYDPIGQVFTYQVAGQSIYQSWAYFLPVSAQIYGETNSLANQMPGGYNVHEIFWDSNVYLNGWVPFRGVPYIEQGNSAYFSLLQNPSYPKVIEIWDKYCAF